MDEYESVDSKNSMLKDICSDLKKDISKLEHANEVLKSERIEIDEKTLVLHEDLSKLKETQRIKEEVFATDFSELESESLELKQKIESLLDENRKLLEKLKQVKTDLTANRLMNRASEALNWLNTHQNQNKK